MPLGVEEVGRLEMAGEVLVLDLHAATGAEPSIVAVPSSATVRLAANGENVPRKVPPM